MTRFRLLVLALLGLILCSLVIPAHAQAGIQVISDTVRITFPESITFEAEFKGGENISSVVLEYGVEQLTCGTVVAKAFPQFTPATQLQVEWTWEMRQSGSLPPGAGLWWRWQVEDTSGLKFTSPRQTVIWLDSLHSWQVISGGNINLHYYEGGQGFGQPLHDSAAQALVRLSQDVGLSPQNPVDIYIYANTNDLRDAILYEPAWIGGQAFPEYNIVIIGVSAAQLDWGQRTEAHELTHVLVGQLTFTCLGFIPTWLNEGLAMYGEGGPQPTEIAQFDQARTANQLLPLGSLAGNFSEEADRATLSYTESYSVVDFLIHTYGRDKISALLNALHNGATADEALQVVYGFDTNGLENAWRASIGLAPLSGTSNLTPVATATQVPTFIPVGAVPVTPAFPTPRPNQVQATATQGTSTVLPGTTVTSEPLTQAPGISKNLMLGVEIGLVCCILVVLVIIIVVIVSTRRRSGRQK